jgi:hypothetical protein
MSDPTVNPHPFATTQWIWCEDTPPNAYVLFCQRIDLPAPGAPVQVRISASYHYELFLNGAFVMRGPVHGDPQWCQYDELEYVPAEDETALDVLILVHHAGEINLAYLLPAPGGMIAEFQVGELCVGTDTTWRCTVLEMWAQDVPRRGWALDYCEDYDAKLEPEGWQEKRVAPEQTASWEQAALVPDADQIWDNYQRRMTPALERKWIDPVSFRAYDAPGPGAANVGDLSVCHDEETLLPQSEWAPHDVHATNVALETANAICVDLGRERIAFYAFEIDAPAGMVLEVSGAELLRDGRPWVYRKNTRYSMRYRTRAGRQRFVSFGWNGFRYLHLVVRGSTEGLIIWRLGCLERKAPLSPARALHAKDADLQAVYDLCRYTLEIGAQEHLIDCPTREQTQYWGDAIWIAVSLWEGFGERSYLEWYLEGYLRAPLSVRTPFDEHGQLSATYPGYHTPLLDYSLIPLLGQPIYKQRTGAYYRPEATYAKASLLKRWYDAHLNAQGLVDFDYQEYAEQGLRNFIDHPGVGWHNFPHPGIDRDGVSAPLNLFFYAFVRALGEIAAHLGRPEATRLSFQAEGLAQEIRRTFYDGCVFHDALSDGQLSEGTSWQTNALAVFFGLLQGEEATCAMRLMLEGYDWLCRCTPYFYFYFLPALRLAGLETEARALIAREWGQMLARDATTTWEAFGGDERDSLCHPWSTAPFLFLLEP